jgi:hypothetical protein
MKPPAAASYLRGCDTIRNRATGSPDAVVLCRTAETAVPTKDTVIACMEPPPVMAVVRRPGAAPRTAWDDPATSRAPREGPPAELWTVDPPGGLLQLPAQNGPRWRAGWRRLV